MNIGKAQQCVGHISSMQVKKSFGMTEALEDMLTCSELEEINVHVVFRVTWYLGPCCQNEG